MGTRKVRVLGIPLYSVETTDSNVQEVDTEVLEGFDPGAFSSPIPVSAEALATIQQQEERATKQSMLERLQAIEAREKVAMPTTGGRSSVPEGVPLLDAIMSEFQQVNPDFEIELLRVLEYLAMFNGDVSYAVENIVDFGNTKHTYSFDESLSEDQVKEMQAELQRAEKVWYSGGMHSLKTDLLVQIATFGCVSAESCPTDKLDGIKEVVTVTPKNIRFKYSKELGKYLPYQKVSSAGSGVTLVNGNLHPLNPITYKYYAGKRMSEKPYAIPPFLSALESIMIERDMVCSLKNVIKQMGVFGFLTALIQAPMQNKAINESDEAYVNRMYAYLRMIEPEVQKGFASGVVVGFQKMHEFKVEGNNTNTAGAREMFDLITEMKMAGLKQDPLMLGRNFNVAETMAKVIIAKLGAHTANAQAVAGNFMEDNALLHLRLKGYKLDNIDVEFEQPMLSDKSKDEEAFNKKIVNRVLLRDEGIISQQQVANELGYDEAHLPDRIQRELPVPGGGENTTDDTTDTSLSGVYNVSIGVLSAYDRTRYVSMLEAHIRGDLESFDYGTECTPGCSCHKHAPVSFAKNNKLNKKIQGYIDGYTDATMGTYNKAVEKMAKKIATALGKLEAGTSLQQVQDTVLYTLYNGWGDAFSKSNKKVVSKYVEDIYSYFRQDKSAFGGKATFKLKDGTDTKVPEAAFNTSDVRALNFFADNDNFYLGRFVTDPDTKKRLLDRLKKDYLEDGLPIGANPDQLAKFRDDFPEFMEMEDYKIRRIIDTSVNKMRNYAAINYIGQAGVESFEIVGLSDRLQCDYCAIMNGKKYSVSVAVDKINKTLSAAPEQTPSETPFATSLYKGEEGLERMRGMTAEQLQQSGLYVPFHCNCRCTVVADI